VKVTFKGETKRLKVGCNFTALTNKVRDSFGEALASLQEIKFYYLDEENEVISITT